MGFRTGFVLSSLSFLTGVLFICAQYDHPLVFHAWSDAAPVRAERFYLGLYAAPRAVHALLHGMIALGVVGLLAKLHRWTETAKWFDGAALVFYMGAIGLYGVVIVPNLRLLANPTSMRLLERSSIATQRATLAAEAAAGRLDPALVPTGPLQPDEGVAALRIVAASNTLILGLFVGVALMLTAEYWVEKQERRMLEAAREAEMAELKVQKGQ